MLNLMAALPNIGGALCSTPQSLADAHYYMPCSNATKTQNLLKFVGVPQTTGSFSAASGPKFTSLATGVLHVPTYQCAKFCPVLTTYVWDICSQTSLISLTAWPTNKDTNKTRMWANAQRDGRPAEHRWRPLFNAPKFGWRPLLDAVQ